MLVVVSQAGAVHPWARVISEQESPTDHGRHRAAKEPPNPILPVGKEIIWGARVVPPAVRPDAATGSSPG